jgi:[CysO sulfur-carrier protein]-S-L-cysteine hydrolase
VFGVIELPRDLFDEIVTHAKAGLPNEACGILAGTDGRPVRHFPMRNAEESSTVYRFDGQQQLQVFTEIEEAGLDVLAFWHSHTHSEAYPSPTDRRIAYWRDPATGEEVPAFPGTMYLVLSLQDRDHPVIRGFLFEGGDPVEEEVQIA